MENPHFAFSVILCFRVENSVSIFQSTVQQDEFASAAFSLKVFIRKGLSSAGSSLGGAVLFSQTKICFTLSMLAEIWKNPDEVAGADC